METKLLEYLKSENYELKCKLSNLETVLDKRDADLTRLRFIIEQNNLLLFTGELDGKGVNWCSNDNFFTDITGFNFPSKPELTYDNMKRLLLADDKKLPGLQIRFLKKKKGDNFSGLFRLSNVKGSFNWFYSSLKVINGASLAANIRCSGFVMLFKFDYRVLRQLYAFICLLKRRKVKELMKHISARDIKIVLLVAKGRKNSEIAPLLAMSERGIEEVKSRLFKLTGSPNSAALVHWFHKKGLI